MASRRLLVASLATLRAARGFLPHASRRRHFGAPRAEEDYIESTTNALVKRFKRCHRKKHRDAENVVLVEGRAFVAEVLARGDDVEAVLVADDVTLDESLLARAKRTARAPDFVLKAASTTDSPQGCVALVAKPDVIHTPGVEGVIFEFVRSNCKQTCWLVNDKDGIILVKNFQFVFIFG